MDHVVDRAVGHGSGDKGDHDAGHAGELVVSKAVGQTGGQGGEYDAQLGVCHNECGAVDQGVGHAAQRAVGQGGGQGRGLDDCQAGH